MTNQNNQDTENTTFYDQADKNFEREIKKLSKKSDKDNAEKEVEENEDASLQDDSYSFDESNTGSEEYHDADDGKVLDTDSEVDYP